MKTHKILIEITTKELKYFMDKLHDTIFSFRLKKDEVLEWRQLHDALGHGDEEYAYSGEEE